MNLLIIYDKNEIEFHFKQTKITKNQYKSLDYKTDEHDCVSRILE